MTDNYSYWNNNPNNYSANYDFFDGWDNAKTPVRVPAGTYIAVLTGWETGFNRQTPQLKFTYRIERGEFAGQLIIGQRALTTKAMGYTRQFCDSLGIDPRRSVSDYPKIWVELKTILKDGSNGRTFSEVQSVRRIVPPEEQSTAQTSNPVPGSGQQSELPPGAF